MTDVWAQYTRAATALLAPAPQPQLATALDTTAADARVDAAARQLREIEVAIGRAQRLVHETVTTHPDTSSHGAGVRYPHPASAAGAVSILAGYTAAVDAANQQLTRAVLQQEVQAWHQRMRPAPAHAAGPHGPPAHIWDTYFGAASSVVGALVRYDLEIAALERTQRDFVGSAEHRIERVRTLRTEIDATVTTIRNSISVAGQRIPSLLSGPAERVARPYPRCIEEASTLLTDFERKFATSIAPSPPLPLAMSDAGSSTPRWIWAVVGVAIWMSLMFLLFTL